MAKVVLCHSRADLPVDTAVNISSLAPATCLLTMLLTALSNILSNIRPCAICLAPALLSR